MDGIAQTAAPQIVSPLDADERQMVDRALRRMHESMREFCGAWPPARRTPSHLSRDLGVDRTTCQRVTSLAKAQYAGFAMLDTLPGPRALRTLIDACESDDSPPSAQVLGRFRSAVDGLDEVLSNFRSLSELKRKVAAMHMQPGVDGTAAASDGPSQSALTAQEMFFRAAADLTGRRAHVATSIGLYDKVGVAPHELRHFRISGSRGVVARPDALPMVFETFDGEGVHDEVKKPSEGRWQRTPALLHEFTSANWKTVELLPSQGFASRAMEVVRSEEPSDVYIYTAFPVPDPEAQPDGAQNGAQDDIAVHDPIEESWFILYNPAASLIFDLYLHESIARRCLLSLDVHAWQTSFANSPHGRWHTRMPQSPPIVQLGRGIPRGASAGGAAAENHLHQMRLTAELFRRADVDPAEYIGFRCEERFPMWRTGYRFELDFGRTH